MGVTGNILENHRKTMDKEQTLNLLNQKKEQVNAIQKYFENIEVTEDLESFVSTINLTENYLRRIIEDLNNDIVPKSFFQKIAHNIQSISLNSIYSICQPKDGVYDESSILRLKSIIPNSQLNTNDLYTTYIFFSDLYFVSESTLIIGANGSGKSTLASTLKVTIDERDGIVIPAQKLLIVPTFDNTPNFSNSSSEYESYQKNHSDGKTTYNASKTNDIPYSEVQKYGAEYKYVLKTLLAERGHVRNIFCNKFEKGEIVTKEALNSKLDKAIEIWNNLIEHREIFCDDSNNLMIKDKDTNEIYQAHKMSDGEKNILYLIGRVLLSSNNALILIDEPEMYLHKSIVNKLWDTLELERKDCTFVYLTHDLDFASSRKAKKYWIKSFKHPNNWDIQIIPENEIPESLLMKLLGSRKKILFCEGKINSLDTKIFETLFPNYTIASVSSCSDVIKYVRVFNKIPNKNTDAIGFIDRDFRTDKQLAKLKTENVFSYSVAEIENLFLTKDFITKYAEYKKENIDLNLLDEKVMKLLLRDKEIQVSNYLSSFLNYNFTESHIKKGNSKTEVKQNLEAFINNIDLEELHKKRSELIDKIIAEIDYDLAIKIYNNKGLLGCIEDIMGLKSNTYRDKALDFLKLNDDAKEILKNTLNPI